MPRAESGQLADARWGSIARALSKQRTAPSPLSHQQRGRTMSQPDQIAQHTRHHAPLNPPLSPHKTIAKRQVDGHDWIDIKARLREVMERPEYRSLIDTKPAETDLPEAQVAIESEYMRYRTTFEPLSSPGDQPAGLAAGLDAWYRRERPALMLIWTAMDAIVESRRAPATPQVYGPRLRPDLGAATQERLVERDDDEDCILISTVTAEQREATARDAALVLDDVAVEAPAEPSAAAATDVEHRKFPSQSAVACDSQVLCARLLVCFQSTENTRADPLTEQISCVFRGGGSGA